MRYTTPLPSQEFLLAKFEYEPETGHLIHKTNSYKGHKAGTVVWNGYVKVRIAGKKLAVHRLVWKMHHGEDPYALDHINNDKTDNRIENLRSVTDSENCLDRDLDRDFSRYLKLRADNTNGTPGLCRVKNRHGNLRWQGIFFAANKRYKTGASKDKELTIRRLAELRAKVAL